MRIILKFIFIFSAINIYGQTWECLTNINLNDFVYGINVYKGKLIITGGFYKNNNFSTNGILEWNGSGINDFKNGLRRNKNNYHAQVGQSYSFKDTLYVIGDFDTAGSIPAKRIARWDGMNWSDMGKGPNGSLNCLVEYNNELYAAGSFDSIDGISAHNIARWDGKNWHSLGSGIIGNSVNCLYVYKNELYASGAIDSVNGKVSLGIARWNGFKWNSVSSLIKAGNCMIEWDGNLLIGSQFNFNNTGLNQQIMQWNGSSCALFSEQEMPSITDFKIYNKQLYCSGTGPTRTSNFSYVNIYNPITKHWDLIGEKLNRSVNVLYVLNDSLFAGGAFNKDDSAFCNFIAQLNAKNTSNHDIKNYSTSVKFNSDKKEIIVSVFDTNLTISITDIQGKLVYKKTLLQPTSIIEDFNYNGLFIWQITAGSKTISAGKLMLY